MTKILSVILVGFFPVLLDLAAGRLYAQGPLRQRETNPNYEQGDWVSYANARHVTSIAIGDRYVYFGTMQSGISRFHQFENRWHFPWTTSNGLGDNQVWTVAFDYDTGYLWCATHTAVSYYQPTSEKWTNFYKDEFGLPLADEIESIGVGQNVILLESQAGRLFEINKFGGAVLIANNNSNGYFRSSEIKWFGRRGSRKKPYPHFFMNNGYLFDPRGIIEDPRFTRAEIVASVEDEWGNLWVGTDGLGAGKGDVRSLRLEMLDFGLRNSAVHALTLHHDRLWSGGVLVTEQNLGITSWDWDRGIWKYYQQRDVSEMRSDVIYSITPDGEDLWFSTGHGLSRYDLKERNWKTFDTFDGLSENVVFDAAVDDSSIWVGTSNGLNRIPRKNLGKDSLKVEQISEDNLTTVEVYDLERMENLLWAGTRFGVFVYDTQKGEGGFSTEFQGPTNSPVISISRFENEVWFASADGIDAFDVNTKEWLDLPEGGFFPNTRIHRVLANGDAVWVGTDQGILKLDRESKLWRRFTVEDGLIDNHVNVIALDGDHIWFGTDRGLTQFYWNDPNRVD